MPNSLSALLNIWAFPQSKRSQYIPSPSHLHLILLNEHKSSCSQIQDWFLSPWFPSDLVVNQWLRSPFPTLQVPKTLVPGHDFHECHTHLQEPDLGLPLELAIKELRKLLSKSMLKKLLVESRRWVRKLLLESRKNGELCLE